MTASKASALAVLVFVGLGLSRSLDRFVLLFLRQETGEGLLSAMARNLRGEEVLMEIAGVLGFGIVLWLAFALALSWLSRRPLGAALPEATRVSMPLLLGVAFTLIAVLSLIISPRFPYGLCLPLTLAYEGAFSSLLLGGLVLVSAVRILATSVPDRIRSAVSLAKIPPSQARAGACVLVATSLLTFAWLTPSRFWSEGEGQGNTFKYYRMAAAVAGAGTLDIAQAEIGGRDATVGEFLARLPRMVASGLGATWELMGSVTRAALRGELYLGEVRATRANRAMFRSPDGGIYYINAPGPGLLLVPAYLLDRALNRRLGGERQVAVILFWNALGALLVLEMVRAARGVTGSVAPGVVSALAIALSTPFVFYTFQVYPELPAALGLLYAFRKLLLEEAPTRRGVLAAGFGLAFLPWLHQKYSVAAAVLALLAAARFLRREAEGTRRTGHLLWLSTPLAVSALSIFVYNHALTGSLRPDATFRAVERVSFTPASAIRGGLGLLFDAENGLFVYAPIYLLGLVGARRLAEKESRKATALTLVLLSYFLIIASFPYWPGAVSTVARYILSIAPFAVLSMALVMRRAAEDGTLAGVATTLAAGSFAIAASFHRDLVPSYLPRLFLERTLYSDPYQYLPNFLSQGILGSGPAHLVKLAAVMAVVAVLVVWLSPRVRGGASEASADASRYPGHALRGAAVLLALIAPAGAFLERVAPTAKDGPQFRDTRILEPRGPIELTVQGKFGFEGEGFWVPASGTTRVLIHSPRRLSSVTLVVDPGPIENVARLSPRGGTPMELELAPSSSERRRVPLGRPYIFRGPRGSRWIYELLVTSERGFVPEELGRGEDRRALGCFVTVSAP